MRIIIDGMGGDNAPSSIVKGAVDASVMMKQEICIVGDERRIREELRKYSYDPAKITVTHAEEVIESGEAPVKAVRAKKKSSMVEGIGMLKKGEGNLFVSAGNTGALMAGGLFILGRIQGIDRPALAVTYPILTGGVSLLVDSGATSECKPNNLLEFATMGSIYAEQVLEIKKPKVGLVNMGIEEGKGTTVLKAAYELLAKSRDEYGRLRFVGNIEAREIPAGVADVLVCDGFVGNVIIKLTEGLALNFFKMIKTELNSGMLSKLGALLLSNKLRGLSALMDYSEYGGAPVLGVRGAIVKMHGSADANAVKNTILKGTAYMEKDVVKNMENAVLELEEISAGE
ncbi:MAG: phosphate acyltransferase PlsX [Clostridiales Family XIII bacterium]|nr:phosphate acyltransferase PlsX [Clostridiales Family XIII bacterium]